MDMTALPGSPVSGTVSVAVPFASLKDTVGSPEMIVPAADELVRSVAVLFSSCCHTILASFP